MFRKMIYKLLLVALMIVLVSGHFATKYNGSPLLAQNREVKAGFYHLLEGRLPD